ncbi:hypothetical protein WME95_48090 [Sorangium sp. So ce327]|uniref:hypothetical protein n=1 Tax=Sorangium sp. So ce327 TaxID=3133301 RepID=UPI003F63A5C5
MGLIVLSVGPGSAATEIARRMRDEADDAAGKRLAGCAPGTASSDVVTPRLQNGRARCAPLSRRGHSRARSVNDSSFYLVGDGMNHRSKKHVTGPVDPNNNKNVLMLRMNLPNDKFVSIGFMVLLFAVAAWILIQNLVHIIGR